jgi:hypothetical protein
VGGWCAIAPAPRLDAQDKGAAEPAKQVAAFLAKHCYACHGPEKKKAGVALHIYKDEASILKDRKRWQDVLHMVTAGEMPPPERPRPKVEESEAFVKAVNAIFEKNDRSARRDPGRVTMRRLNRTEYNNTIRDLVGVDFQPADDFPTDDVGYGFDNIGDVLTVSPLLMERYLAAAENIMTRAIVVGTPPPAPKRRTAGQFLQSQQSKVVRDVSQRSLDIAGELSTTHKLLLAGEYKMSVRAWARNVGSEPVKVAFKVDGKQIGAAEIKSGSGKGNAQTYTAAPIQLQPGDHTITLTFLNPYTDEKAANPEEAKRTLFVQYFEFEGPKDMFPPTHTGLMACDPKKPQSEQSREILTRFTTRAYRRPAATDEVERLLRFVDQAQKDGQRFEAGIQLAMQAVLCSPKFLFRVELDDRPDMAEPHAIDDYQLASRLSYFLWSTMPDDELFSLAAKKQLRPNLDAQVRRMLKDAKASALVDNFAMQWLQLRVLNTLNPDKNLFPEFTDKLRGDMIQETLLCFKEIIREDRSILELIDCNYSFVNERLARFYGIDYPGPKGGGGFGRRFGGNEKFEKVTFKNGERGGILTHASILTANSNATRTNPVKRGKWVLEQILGTPPPPPPPDVPLLPDDQKAELKGTLRQRLEQHRKDPTCANCHAKMDPVGLAFENYNAIGKFRAKEGDLPIDPAGVLPSGQAFKGPQELKKILLGKKELFSRCLVEKMLTYSLGRGLDYFDKPAVDSIVAALAKDDYRFSGLVRSIVQSEPFCMRRGKDQAE